MKTEWRVNTKAFLACALLLVFVWSSLLLAQAQKKQSAKAADGHPSSVPYWEIGNRVQIIGVFGKPLGTYLTLEGKRVGKAKYPTKSGPGNFLVEKVNGKPLSRPVTIWSEKVKEWPMEARGVVEGYETGEMIGVPEDVLKHGGMPAQAVWQFHVDFISLSARLAQ